MTTLFAALDVATGSLPTRRFVGIAAASSCSSCAPVGHMARGAQARDASPTLWAAAVEIVAEHGACRVGGELNLDYDMLKRRVARAGGQVKTTELAPRLVELFAPAGAMPAQNAQPDCVVELANARGARMRLKLNGHGLGSLSALCTAFRAAP